MSQSLADSVTSILESIEEDSTSFSDIESAVLALFDQEEEIILEQKLLSAQGSLTTDDVLNISENDLHAQLQIAERELLEARAEYLIRNKVIQNVVISDPILKAVHSNATPAERRLNCLINERDLLSMINSTLTSKLSTLSSDLTETDEANVSLNQRNRDLASILIPLAQELKSQKTDEVSDPKLRLQIQQLDAQNRISIRCKRTMKSITSGIIVGSGIAWANDDNLRDLVMDDEDDGE